MRRILLALVSLAAIAAVFLLPPADPARLAALDAYQLLSLPPALEGPVDGPNSLAAAVLDGPATTRAGKLAKLTLFGVAFHARNPRTDDLNVHALARRSVIRGLREFAASSDYDLSLEVDGEDTATEAGRANGANFLITLDLSLIHI